MPPYWKILQADAQPMFGVIILFGLIIAGIQGADSTNAEQAPRIKPGVPNDAYVVITKAYTLTCDLENGNILSESSVQFAWYRNGSPVITQIDQPTTSLITLDPTSGHLVFLNINQSDIGTYYCTATNEYGNARSRDALLQLAVIGRPFRLQPQNTTAIVGESVVIKCQPPTGSPEPRVLWKQGNNDNIPSGDRFTIDSYGNLTIRDVRRSDQKSYVCIGRNQAGERTSNPIYLTVFQAPQIERKPSDRETNQGLVLTVPCGATGIPPPRIAWEKINHQFESVRSNVDINGTLEIRNIEPDDEGDYKCTATNAAGKATALFHLTVYTPPVFLTSSAHKTARRGNSVRFPCVVDGNPPPVLYWSKTDVTRPIYARQTVGRTSVSEDGSLTITDVEDEDQGSYECTAINIAGIETMTSSLTVRQFDTSSNPPPVITNRPSNITKSLGLTAELTCAARGNPTPTIFWSHNNRPVPTSNRTTVVDGNLRIRNVMVTDGGIYTCMAQSSTGEDTASALLSVVGVRNNVIESNIPAAPGQTVASQNDITSHSIKLYWVSSGNLRYPTTYTVEYFTRQSTDGWVIAGDGIASTSTTIDGLMQGASYIAIVRARNRFGISEPSPISAYIRTVGEVTPRDAYTPEEITRAITQVRVDLNSADVLGSTTLNVTWLLQSPDNGKYVEGFYIRITSNTAPSTTKTVHGRFSNYKITTNLEPCTEYKVMVLPFYHTKTGNPSNLITVTTEEDVPSGPPTEVKVNEVLRYITVTWKSPKPSHQNGVITGYVIVCNAADYALSRNFTVNSTITNVALDNLNRRTEYKIGVAARTKVGVGIISDMKHVRAMMAANHDEPPWLKAAIIGALGGILWVILTVLIVCLYRKRKAAKKAKKQATENGVVTVPVANQNGPTPLFVQYELSRCEPQPSNYPMATLHHRPDYPSQFDFESHNSSRTPNPECDFNIDQHHNSNQFKAFYNKSDTMPCGPYATTAILNNMPERDESLLPQHSPHHALCGSGPVGSTESSCTDNNAAVTSSSGEHSGPPEKRSSTPALPSFAELLPPPPQYPPPSKSTSGPQYGQGPPANYGAVTTMPHPGTCHTCKRQQHHDEVIHRSQQYNPRTMGAGVNYPYHPVYPGQPVHSSPSVHSYQSYHRGTHSSDSHDYAEPNFELQREPIYAGCPPIAHQAIPPPHMLHPSHANPNYQHHPTHHLPISDDDAAVCPSCADQTEYEEPWGDQPWLAWAQLPPDVEEEEAPENERLLAGPPPPPGEASECQSQCSQGTNPSRSGSEDSRSDRKRQRRRQRAQQIPPRPTSPYNGYSTDSSVVFQPRKPYPKSQRRKQMTNKKVPMKSLAVQVEQEEVIPIQHDKV